MPVDIYTFLRIGGGMANKVFRFGVVEHMREFRSLFGMAPVTCVDLWKHLHRNSKLPKKATPKHLLWAVLFLKVYGTETDMSSRVRTTRKTFRKWVRKMLIAIAGLKPIVVSHTRMLVSVLFYRTFA